MRRRSGMTLVLVLMVMLIGGAFVYVAFSMAENAHNSSMNMVTEDRLYNAAQSGLEWGKTILWIYRNDLETDLITGVNDIEDLNVIIDDGPTSDDWLVNQTHYPDGSPGLPQKPIYTNPNIDLDIKIFDCNYSLASGLTADDISGELPPIVTNQSTVGSGLGGQAQVGFSNLLDPNRNISMLEGDNGLRHTFVIRSIASVSVGTSNERHFGVESMVVISHE